ncbi:helix-turn-helix domain-containing protein [Xylophilus rhododendri]|uniref:Helix-turn-helix domain-containing protein n=1 Tax=Xylophilus rhododendri TaxID=2697032 RepID=A0A857JBM7_9BURK|nr:AraC family transcriptional regulator [Xylophilus rhododendri]QHJ01078.1 helix-turn-helix domain-containing protein [Xylophilus rhododendri]
MSEAMDSLGCMASGLHQDQQLRGSGIVFHRKRAAADGINRVETPAADRGYLVGIAMGHGHQRRIFHGRESASHAFEKGAIYIRNFSDHYRADLQGPMDFLLLEISHEFFENATDGRCDTQVRSLECVTALPDPVLVHLAAAALPMLERPGRASPLFIDQLGVTMATYLLEQYGGAIAGSPRRPRTLSRQLEERAKEMLRARLDGEISVAAVAEACALSRSYFIRAFRETTGLTPHQWLTHQRLELARGLLAKTVQPLAEIATSCGFADQSHFTRVFTQAAGMPPGIWRKAVSPSPPHS